MNLILHFPLVHQEKININKNTRLRLYKLVSNSSSYYPRRVFEICGLARFIGSVSLHTRISAYNRYLVH